MTEYLSSDNRGENAEVIHPRGTTQPMPVLDRMDLAGASASGALASPVTHRPSYQPTGIALADHILDFVDEVTGGKADWLQRLFSYLAIGGFAALVNLAIYGLLSNDVHAPFLVAELAAAEISILANFIPNDRLTFSHLPGHARSWWTRCLRFHMTAIAGTIVTIVVSYTLQRMGLSHTRTEQLIAQACAILVALAFNFTFHHVFTYRHTSVPH